MYALREKIKRAYKPTQGVDKVRPSKKVQEQGINKSL